MNIVAIVKTGPGKPAYFADITFENLMTMKGCPIWPTDEGSFYLGMPSVKSERGNHYRCVELTELLHAAAQSAVLRAIQSLKGVPTQPAVSTRPADTPF